MSKKMSYTDIYQISGITEKTVRKRASTLGITSEIKNRTAYYDPIDAKRIIDFKNNKAILMTRFNLEVTEYFINNKENSVAKISEHFNITIFRAQRYIDNYLKYKCVILESKINFENDL